LSKSSRPSTEHFSIHQNHRSATAALQTDILNDPQSFEHADHLSSKIIQHLSIQQLVNNPSTKLTLCNPHFAQAVPEKKSKQRR
jgi:hypothetical protein